MRKLARTGKPAPRTIKTESFAVDHSLDTDQSPDDYFDAIIGRVVRLGVEGLARHMEQNRGRVQPDPRTPRPSGLYIPSLRDMLGGGSRE